MTVVINGGSGITTPGLSSSANVSLAGAAVKLLNNSGNPVVNQTGAVLQVVQLQQTGVLTFAPGAGVWTDITGAVASITPSSTSNKVLVFYTTFMASSQNAPYWMQYARITRNGTAVAVGTQASYKAAGAANYSYNNQYGGPVTQTFLDSPSSTSSVTYQLQGAGESGFSTGGSYTSGTNNVSVPTTIILMEIAG